MESSFRGDMISGQDELLSICIPTFNRAPLLKELLAAIGREIGLSPELASQVGVYISDNASTDQTQDVVRQAKAGIPSLHYFRNDTNIGGNPNILHVRTLARGFYTWILGDDELLQEGSLESVLNMLHTREHGLIVLFDSLYDAGFPRPAVFADYAEYVRFCVKWNPHAVVEHTLISANIYRSDCFAPDVARQYSDMFYPHMYGMIRPLFQNKLSVYVPDTPVITVREFDRPYGDGGSHPPVDEAWQTYLAWLREELGIQELDVMAPSRIARKLMIRKMLRHPILFFWRNRGAFFQPSAYRHLFVRTFLLRRKLEKNSGLAF